MESATLSELGHSHSRVLADSVLLVSLFVLEGHQVVSGVYVLRARVRAFSFPKV